MKEIIKRAERFACTSVSFRRICTTNSLSVRIPSERFSSKQIKFKKKIEYLGNVYAFRKLATVDIILMTTADRRVRTEVPV
jgi:hypothetical protein